ncbi:MAG TPA: hypothetical protein VFO86_07240 [Terriglobia bacterium]|nr:hypothetical protein [Terriglobia bacterium]
MGRNLLAQLAERELIPLTRQEITGIAAELFPTAADICKIQALRPRYSVLENAPLKQLELNRMHCWREGLTEYLNSKTRLVSFAG